MKPIITAIIILAILLGCKPTSKQTQAPAPGAPSAALESASLTKTKSPITGALGFLLGQKLDDAAKLDADEDGAGLGMAIDTTNFPPFDTIVVQTLLDRRIYSITGMYHGDNWFEESRTLRVALEGKYGGSQERDFYGSKTFKWADEHHSILLDKDTLDYQDDDLNKLHSQAKADAKAKKAKQIAPNL